ncbi:ImuA family protein [Methylocapsa acidiphila]|uniref:ImuA family protein n=1 Tax=Methylocapsa acidiphila TaxID=133552 RepID=UPI000408F137|nr:hypothetical protein [Methylocapsa acidiphila]
MSQGGKSERMNFLRRKIAGIEAGGLDPEGIEADAAQVSLGENCSLDRPLQGGLRRGALHEIAPARADDAAAASGFALALSARFAAQAAPPQSNIVWIIEDFAGVENGAPYGPGLALSGVDPARLLFVHTLNAKDSLWTMEEALKCRAAAAVIAEIWSLEKAYGLAASRRLVLAAQKSGTPGLMLAAGMARRADLFSSSAQTRFEILTRPSLHAPSARGMPLPGPACWSVRIVKARAGPDGFGFDRERFFAVHWDHEKACFRDAFPLSLPSLSRNRPDHSADARARRSQTA